MNHARTPASGGRAGRRHRRAMSAATPTNPTAQSDPKRYRNTNSGLSASGIVLKNSKRSRSDSVRSLKWKHVPTTRTNAKETWIQSLVRRRYGCSDAGPNVRCCHRFDGTDSLGVAAASPVTVPAAASVVLLNRSR